LGVLLFLLVVLFFLEYFCLVRLGFVLGMAVSESWNNGGEFIGIYSSSLVFLEQNRTIRGWRAWGCGRKRACMR